jgi:hypothetical protein
MDEAQALSAGGRLPAHAVVFVYRGAELPRQGLDPRENGLAILRLRHKGFAAGDEAGSQADLGSPLEVATVGEDRGLPRLRAVAGEKEVPKAVGDKGAFVDLESLEHVWVMTDHKIRAGLFSPETEDGRATCLSVFVVRPSAGKTPGSRGDEIGDASDNAFGVEADQPVQQFRRPMFDELVRQAQG